MGAVYRARHEITKAIVAIKILRPDLTFSGQEGVSLFFEEATKTVALNHPSIIRVTNADYTADGWAYMVMEWLDGRTLDNEMKEQGVLSLQRTTSILDQITDAIAYAHNKGIIHRDLKPSNIMLVAGESGEETVRVLDFGIAKVLSTTIGINTRVAGTSYYISPEQTVAHGRIDQSSDIYSLGVILYQMLTGQVPFEADTEGQVMDMHRSIAPKPLREIRPSIPQAVEEVVLKAIAKKSTDRYQTAVELARAFRHAANLASSLLALQCKDAQNGAAVFSADVYLNGRLVGQSNEEGWWREKNMMPRQYLIEVESPRYTRWHRSIELGAREALTIVADLKREQAGEIIVCCKVADVNVAIDGEISGRTNQHGRLYIQSIPVGTHTVKVTHPQYFPGEVMVNVDVWQQVYVTFELTVRPQRVLFKAVKRQIGSLTGEFSARQVGDFARKMLDRLKSAAPEEDRAWPGQETISGRTEKRPPERTCAKCGERIPMELSFCTQCGLYLGPARKAQAADRSASGLIEGEPGSASVYPAIVPATAGGQRRGGTAVVLRPPTAIYTRPANRNRPLATKGLWPALAAFILLLCLAATWIIFFNAPKHTLTIKVSPPGSRVVIDDRIEKATDDQGQLSIGELESGLHTIKVSKPGYEGIAQSITLPIRQPLQLALEKRESPIETPEGMVFVPGGTFTMGYRRAARNNPAGPEHKVTVGPFFIDRYEVTRGAYSREGKLSEESRELPVTGVTWREANNYCRGIGKRLPTEAEWEFAARGADRRLYPWGDRFEANRANVGTQKPSPVGSYPAGNSPFGLSDMSGNAMEWTDSNFVKYPGSPYRSRRCKDPCKVIRGGAYFDNPQNATAVFRREYEPTALKQVKNAYAVLGFRCARAATPR